MPQINVNCSAVLEVDVPAAEVLNYLTSYALLGEFHQRFGQRYTLEELHAILNQIHCETARIIRTHNAIQKVLAAVPNN